MTLETAQQLYVDIMASDFTDLATELVDAAIRYARLRTDWCGIRPARDSDAAPV